MKSFTVSIEETTVNRSAYYVVTANNVKVFEGKNEHAAGLAAILSFMRDMPDYEYDLEDVARAYSNR
jgi:hypothetical protein